MTRPRHPVPIPLVGEVMLLFTDGSNLVGVPVDEKELQEQPEKIVQYAMAKADHNFRHYAQFGVLPQDQAENVPYTGFFRD